MREPENIRSVLKLNPEYMGFIFYEGSPRYVGKDFSLKDIVFSHTKKIGVFVNENKEKIEQLILQHKLDGIQLHGNESLLDCEYFKEKTMLIKAVSVEENIDLKYLKTLENKCHLLLFDTKTKIYGGSGKTFNWELLKQVRLPFLLSGGISNEVLENINLPKNSNLKGIDLNSQYEISAGLKNLEKLKVVFKNKNNGNFKQS